jgi:hypothetical protein
MFPEFKIEQLSPSGAPDSLESYVNRIVGDPKATVVLGPNSLVIQGQPGKEIAAGSPAMFCSVDGSDPLIADLISHEIIFAFGGLYYRCELLTTPDRHLEYVRVLRSICQSVRFPSGKACVCHATPET